MDILYGIICAVILILQIFLLVQAVKSEYKNKWVALFSYIVFSTASAFGCGLGLSEYAGWKQGLLILGVMLVGAVSYGIMLLVSIVLCIIRAAARRKKNLKPDRLEMKEIVFSILIPLGVALLPFLISTVSIKSVNTVRENRYNNTKNTEIAKMSSFINEKYNLNTTDGCCVFYREEDKMVHPSFLAPAVTYDIPYLGIFETDMGRVTVSDRDGFLSDNGQIHEVGKILADYYSAKTGIDFDYVSVGKTYEGSWKGNDNVVAVILQTKFNDVIDENNTDDFMDCILSEDDISIKFYMSDEISENDILQELNEKLGFLDNYENVGKAEVYVYSGELETTDYEPDTGDNRDDFYKFGCSYVNPDENEISYIASMVLDRGYGPSGEKGSWVITEYKSR